MEVGLQKALIYSYANRDASRANIRMCEKFANGRVFLIGGGYIHDIIQRKRLSRFDRTDAAHCHSPFGAQGMNSGIQDAVSNCYIVLGPWTY